MDYAESRLKKPHRDISDFVESTYGFGEAASIMPQTAYQAPETLRNDSLLSLRARPLAIKNFPPRLGRRPT